MNITHLDDLVYGYTQITDPNTRTLAQRAADDIKPRLRRATELAVIETDYPPLLLGVGLGVRADHRTLTTRNRCKCDKTDRFTIATTATEGSPVDNIFNIRLAAFAAR